MYSLHIPIALESLISVGFSRIFDQRKRATILQILHSELDQNMLTWLKKLKFEENPKKLFVY